MFLKSYSSLGFYYLYDWQIVYLDVSQQIIEYKDCGYYADMDRHNSDMQNLNLKIDDFEELIFDTWDVSWWSKS